MRYGLLACVVGLSACGNFDFADGNGNVVAPSGVISVDPMSWDFGTVPRGQVGEATFNIGSHGFAPLRIQELYIDGPSDFYIEPLTEEIILDPWELTSITAEYSPVEGGNQEAVLHIVSNDKNRPDIAIPLYAFGDMPGIVVSPDPVDFGQTLIGCDHAQFVTILNDSDEDVSLTNVQMSEMDGVTLNYSFSLPQPLAPGEWVQAEVIYEPGVELPVNGLITATPDGDIEPGSAGVLGEGAYVATPTDVFVVPDIQPIDFLFAVDQSGSMDDQNSALGAAFSTFISEINAVTSDWNIGVVTNDNGCFNSGVISSSTSNYSSVFSSAVLSGGCGGGYPSCMTESLLDLVSAALNKTSPGQCNSAFRNDMTAPLHIVLLSDEKYQPYFSGSTWQNQLAGFNVYSPAVPLKVHLIGDITTSCGDGSGAGGYTQVADATGGLKLNICLSDWADDIVDIATSALEDLQSYPLSVPRGDGNNMRVWVEGVEWTEGWHFDEQENKVVFDVEMESGDTVEVTYGVFPETCP